jgi:hypothetical protein
MCSRTSSYQLTRSVRRVDDGVHAGLREQFGNCDGLALYVKPVHLDSTRYIAKQVACWTAIGVFFRDVSKLMLRVEALCLLLSIQHGYVRRHLPIRKPGRELTRPVALVSSDADGLQSEPFFCPFQHLPGRNPSGSARPVGS